MNNYAIDTAGLAEAITRAGASLSAAGNDLSESMGLVVAANDSLQDPSSVGQMLKTMSMRLRGASAKDLEELGIDTEGMTQGSKSIVQIYKSMAGIDIMEGTNYKSTMQVLRELHDRWQDLTDAERAAITEATGGKRGGSVMSSLMTNWEDAEAAFKTAEESIGSAEKEQEAYAQSVQYSIDRAKASLQELAYDTLSTDLVKGAIEAFIKLVNLVDELVKALGGIPVVAGAIGSGFLIKKLLEGSVLGQIGSLTSEINILNSTLLGTADAAGTVSPAMAKLVTTFAAGAGEAEGFAAVLGGLGAVLEPLLPLLPVLAAAAAVIGGIAIADALTTTADEAGKAFEKTNQELQKTKQEIESITSEIERNNEQLGNLDPVVDETQVSNLKDEILLLEKRRDILERTEQIENKKNAKNAYEEATSGQGFFGSGENYIEEAQRLLNDRAEEEKGKSELLEQLKVADMSVEKYNELVSEADKLEEKLKNMRPEDNPDEYQRISNQILELDAQIKAFENQDTLLEDIETAEGNIQADDERLSELITTLSKAKEAMEATGDDQYKETIAQIESIEGKYISTIEHVGSSAKKEVDEVYEKISSVEELANSISALATNAGQLDLASEIYNDVKDGGTFDFNKLVDEGDGKFRSVFGVYEKEYEALLKVIMESPTDIKKTQQAWDDLITAWVYGSGELENVTEETRLAAIQSLKQQGIENAQEIVDAYLKEAKAVEKYKQALLDLAPAYENTRKALNRFKLQIAKNNFNQKDVKAYRKELNNLKKTLSTVMKQDLSVSDAEMFSKDINNLNNLADALDGDVEALYRVKAAIIENQMLEINPEINTDKFHDDLLDLQGWIESNPDLGTLEAQATFNTNPFVQACLAMIQTGQATAQEIQSIFDALDIDATVTYKEIDAPYIPTTEEWETGEYTYVGPGAGYMKGNTHVTQKIRVPEVKYGTKTKAHVDSYKPIDTSSNKGGGSGGGGGSKDKSKKEKDKFFEEYDWIEKRLNHLQRAIEKFNTLVSGTWRSWHERAHNLNEEIKTTRKLIKANEDAAESYEKHAQDVIKTASGKVVGKEALNASGKTDEDGNVIRTTLKKGQRYYINDQGQKQALSSKQYKEFKRLTGLIKRGKIGKNDIEGISDEVLRNVVADWKDFWDKSTDAEKAALEEQDNLYSEYQQQFDLIISKYDAKISAIEHKKSMLDERVSQFEASGLLASHDNLNREEELIIKESKKRQKEIAELREARDNFVKAGGSKNSEEYAGFQEKIRSLLLEEEQVQTRLLQLQKEHNELEKQRYDYIQNGIGKISEEAQFLIDLMSGDKLVKSLDQYTTSQLSADWSKFQGMGQLTKEGQATMAMYAVQYETAMRQAEESDKAIAHWQKELAKSPYNTDIQGYLDEEIKRKRELIKTNKQVQQSMIELAKQGVQAEIDAVSKLVSLYTERLDSMKEMQDYQKNIEDQAKNINKIQKRLSAYQGDTSEENRVRLQKLQDELKDAQEKLEETETEHLISEQKKMLNNLVQEYSETLNLLFNDTDALIERLIEQTNSNSSVVKATIEEEVGQVGYTISDEMSSALDNREIAAYYNSDDYKNKVTGVSDFCNTFWEKFKQQVKYSETTNDTSGNSASSGNSSGQAQFSDASQKNVLRYQIQNLDKEIDKLEQERDEIFAKWWNATGTASRNALKSAYDSKVKTIENKKAQRDKLQNRLDNFARGVHNISEDQYAWTQENGNGEAIIRKKDGALLTPLKKGDSVLTSAQTESLYSLATDPTEFIKKSLLGAGQTHAVNNNSTSIGDVAFTVTLPNVSNYSEFKQQMKNDKSFETFLRSVTTDRVFGASSLKKYNR